MLKKKLDHPYLNDVDAADTLR